MKTAAAILGLVEDPAMEAALVEFRSQTGRICQIESQECVGPTRSLKLDWEATWPARGSSDCRRE